MAMLTRDGRLPANRWVVIAYAGGKPRAQVKFKSSAMDRALTLERKTGLRMVVAKIELDEHGKPALFSHWDTGLPGPRKTPGGCGCARSCGPRCECSCHPPLRR